MKLTQYERSVIRGQIKQAEEAIAAANMRLRVDEVNNCDHEWIDESYENGHNGDWEDNFKCRKCGWSVSHQPKEQEHM